MSPLHQVVLAQVQPHDGPTIEYRIRDSAEGPLYQVCLKRLSAPRLLKENIVLAGFRKLPLVYIREFASYLGHDLAAVTLCAALVEMAHFVLPASEVTIVLLVAILLKRELTFEEDEDLEDMCECEYVLDAFDADDRKALSVEIAAAKTTRGSRDDFKTDAKAWKITNIYAGEIPTTSLDRRHPLHKHDFPPRFPTVGINNMPQSEAKRYLPPLASIWRSNKIGAWNGHKPPHRRISETFVKRSGDSHAAMLVLCRRLWRQYLDDNCLPESHRPIAGIF